MTTKAADEYSSIAKRMKELGATSDAPVKIEEQTKVVSDFLPGRVDIDAYRAVATLPVKTRSGLVYVAPVSQSIAIVSTGQVFSTGGTGVGIVSGSGGGSGGANASNQAHVQAGGITWVEQEYDSAFKRLTPVSWTLINNGTIWQSNDGRLVWNVTGNPPAD